MSYTIHDYETREEWLKQRNTFIGASESAALFDEHPWLSRFQLWSQKIGLEPNQDASIPMRVGLALEDLIAEMYEEETGRATCDPGQFTVYRMSRDYQFIAATLDRKTIVENQHIAVELKAVGANKRHEWEEGPPRHYWIQLQHQMLVTGTTKASIAVLVGNREFLWCDVERDPEFCIALRDACESFWLNNVITENPPEVDDRKETAQLLERLYSETPDKTVILPPEIQEVDERFVEVCEQIVTFESEKRLLQNQIRNAIGDATYGELPDCRYSWKTVERKEHVVKASASRVLRRLKKGD